MQEVKLKLPQYDNDLIEDVIKFNITKLSEELVKVRPWKRRIYIHRWAYIEIWFLCFNPFSVYFDYTLTKKLLRKFKKEILLTQKTI